jgi:3-isopropylmalate/(R)-2-methylmalate dehydratase large subunit
VGRRRRPHDPRRLRPGHDRHLHEKFGRQAKVWDRDSVVIIPDHYIFTADQKCHRNVQILRTS